MEPKSSLQRLQVPAICPYPESDQSSPCLHPTSWRSIRILSSHLRLVLPSRLFPSGYPTKTLYAPLPSPIRPTCPVELILDLITWIILGEEYRSLSYSLRSFLHSPVPLSLLGPNILISTLFSNTLNLRFSFHVSYQVADPYKPTGKIIVLYILIFIFWRYITQNYNITNIFPYYLYW